MGKVQEVQLHILTEVAEEVSSPSYTKFNNKSTSPQIEIYKWWIRMAIYTVFILFGQPAATLMVQLYYDRGGKSIWVATFAQAAGFPLLIPHYYISPTKYPNSNFIQLQEPSKFMLASIYISFGIFLAADSMMFSVGFLYLPVSTFFLISASLLAFNALFSFFLHFGKYSPFLISSLVLLTISSTLLIFQTTAANSTKFSPEKYSAGFVSAVAASVGYGLTLSLTQISFRKILGKEAYTTVLETVICQLLVVTCAALVGLFLSGEWQTIEMEMIDFEQGKLYYVLTLMETAIASQVFTFGAVGLIFEVSSIFSNVITVLGLPIVPILGVIFSHEKIVGIRIIAVVLAIWGFSSYICQYYLNDLSSKTDEENVTGISQLHQLDDTR